MINKLNNIIGIDKFQANSIQTEDYIDRGTGIAGAVHTG